MKELVRYKCLLVDDEPLAIQLLKKHLEQLDNFEVVATANNAIKALELLNSLDIDLLFLDIKMPKITGLDLLKTLKNPPKTILTTAYREYALDSYDLEIVDYLLKPITFERFFKAIERFLRQNTKPNLNPQTVLNNDTDFIFIKTHAKSHRVNVAEILYIESLKDYIKIVCKEREISTKYKISDIETELSSKLFLRVHRSFIVNMDNITAFSASEIELGKHQIPIGASYKELVMKEMR